MVKIKSLALGCLLAAVFVCLAGLEKPKLVRTKVNETLSVMIPKDWIPMDAMDFTQRYPSVRAPLAAYTNFERTIDFSVNISATRWPDGNLEMSQKFFKSSLMNLFDRVEIIREGIHEVDKQKMIFFEFESRVDGNRREEGTRDAVLKYTYIQYSVRPDRTLVFSFNCPRRVKDDWQETAHEMMMGVKIK